MPMLADGDRAPSPDRGASTPHSIDAEQLECTRTGAGSRVSRCTTHLIALFWCFITHYITPFFELHFARLGRLSSAPGSR